MSKEVIVRCDVCGQSEALFLSLVTGREVDAAGSVETTTEEMDLCAVHLMAGLVQAMAWLSVANPTVIERNNQLFDYYRALKKTGSGGGK
jgi:hypothetical protein